MTFCKPKGDSQSIGGLKDILFASEFYSTLPFLSVMFINEEVQGLRLNSFVCVILGAVKTLPFRDDASSLRIPPKVVTSFIVISILHNLYSVVCASESAAQMLPTLLGVIYAFLCCLLAVMLDL